MRRKDLCPLLHVCSTWPDGIVRRSEVALVEDPYLTGLECADDRVHHPAIVEQHEVLLPPVVRIDELGQDEQMGESKGKLRTWGAMAGRCIL